MLGFSPDFLAGTNWVLSTVITGLLGILVASTQSTIDPVGLVVLVVPALTAALVGGFSSFGRTTIAAFVLGMQIPLVQYTQGKSWFPNSKGVAWPGFEYLLPVLGIVLVLFLAGNRLPARARSPRAGCPSRRPHRCGRSARAGLSSHLPRPARACSGSVPPTATRSRTP